MFVGGTSGREKRVRGDEKEALEGPDESSGEDNVSLKRFVRGGRAGKGEEVDKGVSKHIPALPFLALT